MAENPKTTDAERMNATLRRMLNTPPKPHKEKDGADTPRRPTKRKVTSSSEDSSASKEGS
jgi:hypothetical protein